MWKIRTWSEIVYTEMEITERNCMYMKMGHRGGMHMRSGEYTERGWRKALR